MKILIAYKSRTGFTKKYAELIAQAVGCDIADFNSINKHKAAEYDVFVYGSRIHAGTIDGLKKARELFVQSGAGEFVVFATGGTPNAAVDVIEDIWRNNLSTEELQGVPHFYMQSGISYEKMNLPDKAIMKLAAKFMSSKKDKDENEKGFEQAITSSYNIFSEDYAQPLIDYLLTKNN